MYFPSNMLVLSENPITAVRAVGVIHILLGRRVAMGQGNRVAAVAMLVLDRHRAVVVGKLDEDADAGQEGAVNGGGQARAAVVSGGGLAQAAAVNGGGGEGGGGDGEGGGGDGEGGGGDGRGGDGGGGEGGGGDGDGEIRRRAAAQGGEGDE